MLHAVSGNIGFCQDGRLELEVGPFRLEILVPLSYRSKTGKRATLYTSLFVREENLVLYGFTTEAEKKFFQLALTVPGVGPKLALSLLSGMPLADLARHIQSGNAKALEKISGVGKKLASRLVGDLKEKAAPFAAVVGKEPKEEAVEILVDLGLEREKAWEAVESVPGNPRSVDDLVNLSLKKLGEGVR